MKKVILIAVLLFATFMSVVSVEAYTESKVESSIENDDSGSAFSVDLDELYNELPEDARQSLKSLGVGINSDNPIEGVTFQNIISEIGKIAAKQGTGVMFSLGVIIAVLLLYSLTEGFFQSMTADTMREVLSVVSALCIACVLVLPVTEVIDAASDAIIAASDFMLTFIPIMVAVLISCGKTLSGSGYYSLMVFAAEGISQLSAKFITPMLNVFLGVSMCSSIVPRVHLESVTDLFAKTIKWLLSFSFTIFSAFLTFKTLISTSIDSVSTRAVRFTMSSFIPVVGAALSEAYKTVQGSVNILKNGIGIFVIFAVAAVFLPIILRLMLWSFSVSLCKSLSVMLGLGIPSKMLSGVSTALSVLLAVLLCIMALFIISTALIMTAGGYGG